MTLFFRTNSYVCGVNGVSFALRRLWGFGSLEFGFTLNFYALPFFGFKQSINYSVIVSSAELFKSCFCSFYRSFFIFMRIYSLPCRYTIYSPLALEISREGKLYIFKAFNSKLYLFARALYRVVKRAVFFIYIN
jgi:hypothetical protein